MIRLNSRSNRSRGVIWLMSGAGPRPGRSDRPGAAGAPGLAMSGTAGAGWSRTTRRRCAPSRTAQSAAGDEPGAPIALRPAGPPAGAAADRLDRSGGRSGPGGTASRPAVAAGPRGLRLAPQALQKLPEAGAAARRTGAGRRWGRGRSWGWKRTPVGSRAGRASVAGPGAACAYRSAVHAGRRPAVPPRHGDRSHGARKAAVERPGRAAEPRRLSPRPERGGQGGPPRASPAASAWTSSGCSSPTSWASTRTWRCPGASSSKALDGEIMFDGSSIEGFVRIEESDMLLKPDLGTFRILPYDDEGRTGRPAALRHLHAGRGAVRRLSPDDAQAPARAGPEARLHDDGGVRGGVLPVREVGRRRVRPRSPTTRRRTSTSGRSTRARRSAGSSSSSWWRWGSRSRRRTTRWPPGSTRSTSGTPTR